MVKQKKHVKGPPQPLSPKARANELRAQIEAVRRRLAEMRDYKRLIEADGLEPDKEDKRIETELIRRLLWLEKQLNPPPPKRPQAKPAESATPKGRRGRNIKPPRARP